MNTTESLEAVTEACESLNEISSLLYMQQGNVKDLLTTRDNTDMQDFNARLRLRVQRNKTFNAFKDIDNRLHSLMGLLASVTKEPVADKHGE